MIAYHSGWGLRCQAGARTHSLKGGGGGKGPPPPPFYTVPHVAAIFALIKITGTHLIPVAAFLPTLVSLNSHPCPKCEPPIPYRHHAWGSSVGNVWAPSGMRRVLGTTPSAGPLPSPQFPLPPSLQTPRRGQRTLGSTGSAHVHAAQGVVPGAARPGRRTGRRRWRSACRQGCAARRPAGPGGIPRPRRLPPLRGRPCTRLLLPPIPHRARDARAVADHDPGQPHRVEGR